MKRLDLGAASQAAAAVEGQTLPVECTGGKAGYFSHNSRSVPLIALIS